MVVMGGNPKRLHPYDAVSLSDELASGGGGGIKSLGLVALKPLAQVRLRPCEINITL